MVNNRAQALDIIIPIEVPENSLAPSGIVEAILQHHKNYGFNRFAIILPSKGWRSIGYPPREHYIDLANMFLKAKTALAPYGIECGVYLATTIKSGPSDGFTSIVNEGGAEHPFASCPLDKKFRERMTRDVALFAKIAKPAFIFLEDDLAFPSDFGCFCKLHLEEFAKRQGRHYSREELMEIFSSNTQEAFELRKKWRTLRRDSLVGFCEAMRSEIDKESPEIPMGYCQSGGADYDGDSTKAITRALAGARHTPFSRLYGTFYCGVDVKRIPEELYHPLYSKQHLDKDFRFYHESDPYPHTRFFTAGVHMKAIMATAFSYGFDGSVFFLPIGDDRAEETVYAKMFVKERARFNAVHKIAKECSVKGVQLDYDPFRNTVDTSCSNKNPLWIKCVSGFGIPFTSEEAPIACWDVRQAKYADDETVMKHLSKGLFLDGDAAACLCERGYGKYIGVEMGEDVNINTNIGYDLGASEIICDRFVQRGRGRHMPSAHMFSMAGNGKWLRMTVTDEKCEVVTEAYTFKNKLITPAMTRFVNSLGGRVVVMSLTLDGNGSHALLNYRRKRLLQELMVWCCDDNVMVLENPYVFVIVNEAERSDESGLVGMLTLINLCEDETEGFALHLPPHWCKAQKFSILGQDGKWHDAEYSLSGNEIKFTENLRFCEPVYIKGEK